MAAITLKIDAENTEKQAKKASLMLKKGRVIAYPTETSYGLGCNALNAKAIEKMIKAKEQPKDKPISVLFAGEKMAEKYVKINENTRKLIHNFMPGPLTIICEKKKGKLKHLPESTLAWRISSNKFAFSLSKDCSFPVTATSANIHGLPDVYDSIELKKIFSDKIDAIIDAGKLPKRIPSTIYDCANGKILREGSIKEKEIIQALKSTQKKSLRKAVNCKIKK